MADEPDDKPKPLDQSWSHLFLRDARTPEEIQEAESKERRRRRGGRKSWRKEQKPPEG